MASQFPESLTYTEIDRNPLASTGRQPHQITYEVMVASDGPITAVLDHQFIARITTFDASWPRHPSVSTTEALDSLYNRMKTAQQAGASPGLVLIHATPHKDSGIPPVVKQLSVDTLLELSEPRIYEGPIEDPELTVTELPTFVVGCAYADFQFDNETPPSLTARFGNSEFPAAFTAIFGFMHDTLAPDSPVTPDQLGEFMLGLPQPTKSW